MGRKTATLLRQTVSNQDVISTFQGILGSGEGTDLDLKVVYPKYCRIAEHCGRFVRLWSALASSAFIEMFPAEHSAVRAYADRLRDLQSAAFCAADLAAQFPMLGGGVDYSAVTLEAYKAFDAVYKQVKDSEIVNTAIITCKNLITHKRALSSPTEVNDKFLTRSAGTIFSPIEFLDVNFKMLYNDGRISTDDRLFLWMVLHKALKITHEVYEAISSPDVDVDEFVSLIVNNLGEIKRHIPRCDEAFDHILNSVHLLKGNFGEYYRDYVASNNPSIIMENFVLDVSKTSGSSPRIAGQFRKIISHYRKLAGSRPDQRIQGLFTQIDKNFQELEAASREGAKDDDSGSSSSDDDAPAAATPAAATPAAAVPADVAPAAAADAATTDAAERRRLRNIKKRERRRLAKHKAATSLADDLGDSTESE